VFRKLFLTFLALWAGGLGVMGFLGSRLTRGRMLQQESVRLEAELELAAALVRGTAEASHRQTALASLGRRRGVRFTLVDEQGKVLAESDADPAGMPSHAGRPEIRDARERGRGEALRQSDTLQAALMYRAARLDDPPGTVLRAGAPLSRIEATLAAMREALWITFLVLALAGAAGIFFIVRRLTHPLKEIRYVADWVAAGDFSRKAPVGPDEIGPVASALNHMAEELARRLEGIQAERSKLEAVLSSMEEGVLSLDAAGTVLHANAATMRLFDLRRDPAGLLLWEAIHWPGLREAVRSVLDGGEPVKADVDVGQRTLSLRVLPLSGGRGAILVAHDITEDRRYDNLRREFVATVSHELRTPLTMIQGYVETLLEGAWKEERSAPEFLAIIDRNVKRLSAIVRDLLDLSRLESGARPLQLVPVELAGLLDGIRTAFKPLASKRRQEFRIVGSGVVPMDESLVERALSNLVENAMKYTPDGGWVELRAKLESGRLLFEVEDNGPGIPDEDLPRIFERFYRVDKSRSRDLGGTGLGLSIVKHVAQLHGGSVSVRSTVGKGTVFSLEWPIPAS
jgi:two-component system phosphate regulon sensor histidine kinase PhoR